jgi:uncharacterized protein with HXXEE motif
MERISRRYQEKGIMQVTSSETQKDIRRWFGWLVIVGPLHMIEQLLFGIDELYELKRFAAAFYGLFRNPDYASVVLVIVSFSMVNLIVYGLLVGGQWRQFALGVFAMVGLGEVHHVVKTILHRSYFPGAVTSIPFVLFGALLLQSLVTEFRAMSGTALLRNDRAATQEKAPPTPTVHENKSLPLLSGG